MDSTNPQSNPLKRHKSLNPNPNSLDRLSNLPESLIHHILSFMDTKHVVQSSVLSSMWKHYWKSVSFLNFDRNCDKYISDKMFKSFLDDVMYRRFGFKSVTQKFRVDFGEFWKVRMLELPEEVFECKSLRVLELGFKLHWPSNVLDLPETINLPRLKCLKLSSIIFMEDIGKLFSSCPVLETLGIYFCSFAEDTDLIISAMKLKSLVIEDFVMRGHLSESKIKIHAPSLTSFRCKDFMVNDYRLGKFSSLVSADIDMAIDGAVDLEGFGVYIEKKGKHGQRVLSTFKKLCAVQTLRLSSWSLQFLSDVLDELHNQATLFHNLRTLNVKTFCSSACYRSLTCLLKSLPNVETLVMHSEKTQLSKKQHNEQWEKELSAQCMFRHLKLVEIRNFKGCKIEVEFLEFLLKNALSLEKLVVTNYKACSSIEEEFKSFPCASSSVVMSFSGDRHSKRDVIQDNKSAKGR
ncbi:hypothetical protein ACHQM5_009429 [Ranunculus cassubicifolius]